MKRWIWRGLLVVALCRPVAADVLSYVRQPDDAYRWQVGAKVLGGAVNLDLVSQRWQGSEWKHTITVFRPQRVTQPDVAMLLITGGSYKLDSQMMLLPIAAQRLGLTVAVLWDIPNQPLWNLREDGLISYTFDKLLETKDESWPLLFPMTKSAVRAMDALQAYSEQAWGTKLTRFITTGASKRGWTTWFTGVVDPRVVAIMPMVYDNLNLAAQMPHQLELWGHYSPQIEDYTRRGLQAKLTTPDGQRLAAMVDPYTYRARLTMPKLSICGTNDAYWTIDSMNLYRDQLPGERFQTFVPNSGHGLQDYSRVINTIVGFVRQVADGTPRPEFRWQSQVADGQARWTVTAPAATKVVLWHAVGQQGQFAQATWTSEALTKGEAGWTGAVQSER